MLQPQFTSQASPVHPRLHSQRNPVRNKQYRRSAQSQSSINQSTECISECRSSQAIEDEANHGVAFERKFKLRRAVVTLRTGCSQNYNPLKVILSFTDFFKNQLRLDHGRCSKQRDFMGQKHRHLSIIDVCVYKVSKSKATYGCELLQFGIRRTSVLKGQGELVLGVVLSRCLWKTLRLGQDRF